MKTKLFVMVLFILIPALLFSQGIQVKPGTKVTINEGSTLKIMNDGNLLLKDDYSTAPSLLQKGNLTFTGTGQAEIEQYITKDIWHMISSPTNSEVVGAYLWMYFYDYIESTNTWNNVYDPLLQLSIGKGYFIWPYSADPNGINPPSADSAVLKGLPNFQDISLSLSNTDASIKSGWNVMGNPFPCSIDWNGHADWNLNNVGAAMYIMDPVAGNYVVWNYNTGGTNANGGYIASTQGFWVRTADTTGTAASLTLPQSQRLHNNVIFYKSEGTFLPEQLFLYVEGENGSDRSIIGFHSDATAGFDGDLDATYLYGNDEAPALYSHIMGTKYSLNHLPSIEEYSIVPLSFEPKTHGYYYLTASWMDSFSDEIPIFLEDKKDQLFQDLKENSTYEFTSSTDDTKERFNIHFTNPLGTNPTTIDNTHIYAWKNVIYINVPLDLTMDIYVYTLLGQIKETRFNQSGLVKIPVRESTTYYLVKVNSGEKINVKKVYIK